ncbi:MAG: ABC transporter substrate-binding protein [Nitrospirae bacterium]|nr:ABC transporter substrate-binding protein [Nitrospirota bacterium]
MHYRGKPYANCHAGIVCLDSSCPYGRYAAGLNQPDQIEQRRRRIERALRTRISSEEMAARSLGLPWTELNEQEQHEFVDLFIQFLSKSLAAWKFERGPFGESMVEYSDEMVTYLSEQQEKGFSEVKTRIRSQKAETLLDFRLVKLSGDWRVYDIVIDKVSLAGNYRAQFKSITRYFSYAGLENKIHKLLPILKLFEQLVPR